MTTDDKTLLDRATRQAQRGVRVPDADVLGLCRLCRDLDRRNCNLRRAIAELDAEAQ